MRGRRLASAAPLTRGAQGARDDRGQATARKERIARAIAKENPFITATVISDFCKKAAVYLVAFESGVLADPPASGDSLRMVATNHNLAQLL